MIRWAFSVGVLVLLASTPRSVRAEPVVPGTRVASKDELGGRRAIRGAVLEGRESDELAAMRRFEEEQLQPVLGPGALLPQESPPPEWAGLTMPDLPVRWDARLIRFLEFYKNDKRGRAIMTSWLRAQGRYRALIEEGLARHHLPHALLYIAMIESGYDPHDRSLAGASGVWQFMPEGARIYGLRVDHWVDERDDPEKATEAQMRYFGDLWTRFGSWHIALAAFNAGYGAALSAIAKYNTNDYWTLCTYEDGLPWETVLYVPKFLAAAIVGENRAFFGYDDVVADPAIAWDGVTVGRSVTVEEAARAAGVTVAEVARLNPALRQDRTPPGDRTLLKLPKGSGARFLAHAGALDREKESLSVYRWKQGDRLERIARIHHTSVAALRRLNGIKEQTALRPGLPLLVPPAPKLAMRAADEPEAPIVVAVSDKDEQIEGRKRVFYRVAPGDGVAEIARHFGVREEDLVRWNRLDVRGRLTSHLILQVWVDPKRVENGELAGVLDPERPDGPPVKVMTAGSEEFLDVVEGQRGRKRMKYTVRSGDTLKRIGLRFGLTEGDLERINQLGRGTPLQPGQTIIVYIPMTAHERDVFAARLAGKALPEDDKDEKVQELKPAVTAAASPPSDDGIKPHVIPPVESPPAPAPAAADPDDNGDDDAPTAAAPPPAPPPPPPPPPSAAAPSPKLPRLRELPPPPVVPPPAP